MESLDTGAIWDQLEADLSRFIRRRVSDDAVAEDLLQDVFLRIHEKLDGLTHGERVAPWVYRIARNRIADHYRARRPTTALDQIPEPADPDADAPEFEPDPNQVLGAWLRSMISRLPVRYREAIELVELHGATQREVADQLGLSISGAKSRVQRGREKLRAMLEQCCRVERDRRGRVIDFSPRRGPCSNC